MPLSSSSSSFSLFWDCCILWFLTARATFSCYQFKSKLLWYETKIIIVYIKNLKRGVSVGECLGTGDPEFKSRSDHKLNLSQVAWFNSSAAPVQSQLVCLLSALGFLTLFSSDICRIQVQISPRLPVINPFIKFIQAKTNDKKVRRFGDILSNAAHWTLSYSWDRMLNLVSLDSGAKISPKRRIFLSIIFACICLSTSLLIIKFSTFNALRI